MQKVLVSPSNSWYRNNQIANVLWDLDVRFVKALGVTDVIPVWWRVIYIAGNTGLGVLLSLSFINRLMMRVLREWTCYVAEENFLPPYYYETLKFSSWPLYVSSLVPRLDG